MTTEQEKLILGQAQHLIASLMAYELLQKSLPDDKYRKLWEKVTQQLKLVHMEANRSLVAEREADRAAMRDALEALEIGLDGARDAALEMRMKYGGYMNRLQQAADNDVRKIEAALTHLRQRLEGTT